MNAIIWTFQYKHVPTVSINETLGPLTERGKKSTFNVLICTALKPFSSRGLYINKSLYGFSPKRKVISNFVLIRLIICTGFISYLVSDERKI